MRTSPVRNHRKTRVSNGVSRGLRSKSRLSLVDKRILNRLQEDIPFRARPWGSIAKELNIKEDFLLERIAFFKKKGIIRRISAIFAPGKINFVSTLIGVKASPGSIDRVAEEINSCPEVTHNYRRDSEYNIWFTLVAEKRERIVRIMRRLKKNKGIKKMSEFPIVRLFKINVKFAA